MKNAIITGITGQDGAYLARFLLARGYRVTGAYRRTSSVNFWRLQELGVLQHKQLVLAEFDITDLSSCVRLLDKVQPDEIYNLAAQSFVGVSFEQPIATGEITGLGVVNLLEAVRIVNSSIRFYQASTSELFGKAQTVPQNESTPFYPRSPYGAAKLYAHWMTINYREAYGIFTTSGILFNHESPLRGREFVTRKISDGVARIAHGQLDTLKLGNLDAQRDWGYAEDYVIGMHSMLQVENPDTFVLATGRTATIREFVDLAFAATDTQLEWSGQGARECAVDTRSGRTVVAIDPDFYRPAEVDLLIGDAGKAARELGWSAPTTLEALSRMMVDADMQRVANGVSF
tara:strand:- start:3659 stop:4693 length:1035 start_codon:yes stop_codon:yes gene_type:complete